METEKNIVRKLKKIGKDYDGFFSVLNEANKVSDKRYGVRLHLKNCVIYFIDFLKTQNVIIRYLTIGFTVGLPLFFRYLKKQKDPIVDSISYTTFGVGVFIVFLLILWWIDRSTLMKVTEPTDKLFQIGALEKFRNKEFKRNYDFFQTEVLSFEEMSKELESKITETKKDKEVESQYYEGVIRGKDELLFRSMSTIKEKEAELSDSSVRFYKMDKIFREVLTKMPNIVNNNMSLNELDFHSYFTVHRIDSKQYTIMAAKHPHYYKVAVSMDRRGRNHLIKTEQSKDEYLHIKDTLVSFRMNGFANEKLIVTLYPKSRPTDAVHLKENYDILYVEDIIALWKSFTPLIYSKTNQSIESKGEVKNEQTTNV